MSALSYTSYTKRGGTVSLLPGLTEWMPVSAWRAVPLVIRLAALLIPGGGIFFLEISEAMKYSPIGTTLSILIAPSRVTTHILSQITAVVDTEAFAFAEFRLSPLHSPWIRFESALRMETTGWLFGNIRVAAGWEKTEKTQLISLLYQNDLLSYEESPFSSDSSN